MTYSINKNELQKIINKLIYSKHIPISDTHLINLIENSQYWLDKINVFVYFFSLILDKKIYTENDCKLLIDKIYSLPDSMWLELEEFSEEFINLLITHTPIRKNTLENDLLTVFNHYTQMKFGNVIRN